VGDDVRHPVGGIDYPRTLEEFDTWFSSEDQCRAYLVRLRWPDGFVCPACGATSGWVTARAGIRCTRCQRQTSATAGTVFSGTRKPLRTWFHAIWYVTNQKLGVSALGLQRVLGFGSYQTAWTWLHKLRRAMVRPGRDRLTGEVEIDETYVGGVEHGVVGRRVEKNALVAIAAEVRGRATGRVRMARVLDASAGSLLPFVQAAITKGSVIRTDGWRAYEGLGDLGYDHRPRNIAASGEPAHVVMPRVHLVASLLDRRWLGTHQGAIRPKHLDYYLDEFTFRFNRRRSRARGLLFYRLLQQAAMVEPVPYRDLVGGKESPDHNM
jgi:transposase-like protein